MNYIKLRKNNLCVENIATQKLVKKYQTPFYCYSLSQIKDNYYSIVKSFKDINPLICFSVKSNANLTILKELKRLGSGADVVSIGELLKATKAGIRGNKIVFSGVGIYLVANLGAGPRDGLMVGLQQKTNLPIAAVRAFLVITVVSIGWYLGGTVGIGTLLFAFGVGPAVALGLFLVGKIFYR